MVGRGLLRLKTRNSASYKWKEQEVTTCGRGRQWCGVPDGRGNNINLFSVAFVWEPVGQPSLLHATKFLHHLYGVFCKGS